jgi:protein-S-isoprenylcysteine O-methyltransferase Ste14
MRINSIIINRIHSIATGNSIIRTALAPIVGSAFAVITALFVIIPVKIDGVYHTPVINNIIINRVIGIPVIIIGGILMLWSVWYFLRMKRTPVPVNPPYKLIVSGPYAYARNPMHTGLFILMFGFAIYYGSLLALFIFIPVYIFSDILMLIKIEEPELEKRLGTEYIKYKNMVPRFLPTRGKFSYDDFKTSDE